MLNSIISSTNEYDIVSTDNGNVVSCIGYFSNAIVCMGEYYEDASDNSYAVTKKYFKINKPETEKPKGGNSMTTDDFGPQRWCKKCNSKVKEFSPDFVNSKVAYWHFSRNMYFQGTVLPIESVRCQVSTTYKEDPLSGWECPVCGQITDKEVKFNDEEMSDIEMEEYTKAYKKAKLNKELDMDDLKESYLNLNGKDLKFIRDNKELLKSIYVDHADDAGAKSDSCMNASDTELSVQEQHVFGCKNKRTGKNASIIFKALRYGTDVATKRLDAARDDLNERDYLYFKYLISVGTLDKDVKKALPVYNNKAKYNAKTKKVEHVNPWDLVKFNKMMKEIKEELLNQGIVVEKLFWVAAKHPEHKGEKVWRAFVSMGGKKLEMYKGDWASNWVCSPKVDDPITEIVNELRKYYLAHKS